MSLLQLSPFSSAANSTAMPTWAATVHQPVNGSRLVRRPSGTFELMPISPAFWLGQKLAKSASRVWSVVVSGCRGFENFFTRIISSSHAAASAVPPKERISQLEKREQELMLKIKEAADRINSLTKERDEVGEALDSLLPQGHHPLRREIGWLQYKIDAKTTMIKQAQTEIRENLQTGEGSLAALHEHLRIMEREKAALVSKRDALVVKLKDAENFPRIDEL